MRLVLLAMALAAATAGPSAGESVLVFADGQQMAVASYEVRGAVVVVETLEGKLRSFPAAYLDLETMGGADWREEGEGEIVLPRERDARLRWALEHYGMRPMVETLVSSLRSSVASAGESLPAQFSQDLERVLTAPFSPGRLFEDASRELAGRADPRSIDRFLAWMETPAARRVIAREQWRQLSRSPGLDPSPRTAGTRAGLVRRLLHAGHPAGSLSRSLQEALEEMTRAFREEVSAAVRLIAGEVSWSTMEPGAMEMELESVLGLAYQALDEAELERYVRYWESANGREIGRVMRESFSAAYRRAGQTVGRELARLYETSFGLSDAVPGSAAFPEHNLKFTPPPPEWVAFDATRFNERAVVGYLRRDPQVSFMITAEHEPALVAMTSEDAARAVAANMKLAAEGYRGISRTPHRLGVLDGFLLRSACRIAGRPTHYVHWVHASGGSIYQLVTWAAEEELDLEGLTREATRLFDNFDLLEEAQVVTPTHVLRDHRSERFGYRMRLENAGWAPWEDLPESAPEADLGGLRASSAFLVVPVHFGELDPSMDALASGLLKRLDIDASALDRGRQRDLGDAVRRGLAVDYRRSVDEVDYTYDLRVWKGRHVGYLVAAWTRGTDREVLRDLHERFDFDPSFRMTPGSAPDERERIWQGAILHDIGADYYDAGQYARSAEFFRAASRLRPADVDAVLFLVSSLALTSRFEDALAVLDEKQPSFPDDETLASYRPFLLAKLGRGEEASALYRALFARGYQNDGDLADFVELLLALGRNEEALDEVARYRKNRDSVSAARLDALVHHRMERHDRAIEILEAQLRAFPLDADVIVDLLDVYHDAGRHREAVTRATSFQAASRASSAVEFRKGRAQLELGEIAASKASFETALALNPSNDDVRAYRDYVARLLGEGEQEATRTPIEPVPLPPGLVEPPHAAFGPTGTEDFGAFYLDRSTAVSFRPGREFRRTERHVVRITGSKGVASFGAFRFEVDPLRERVYVNELRVTDETGATLGEGNLATYYLTDASDSVASSDKYLNVPVPGLAVGSTVHLTVTLERRSAPEEFPFFRHALSRSHPAVRSSLYLTGSLDGVRHRASGVTHETMDSGLLWSVREPRVHRDEGFSAPAEDFLPFVWLGAARSSWDALGREYLADIESRLSLDRGTSELARSLVSGRTSRAARIEALADYVQSSLSYRAIEFGRRAWLPSRAQDVVANRYGDCKDHAVLFHLLLRAIDEPSHLVLVSTDAVLEPEVPSLEQFDHMIVFAPGYRGGHYFDLTDKNHDVSSLPPLGLGGRRALLLDRDRPRLVRISDYPEDSSRALLTRRLTFDGEDLLVNEEIVFEGYYGAWLRAGFTGRDAAARRERARRYLGSGRRVTVERLQIDHLTDPKRELVLRMRYRLHGAIHLADGKLVGRIPAAWEKTLLEVPWEPERRTPYRVTYPLRIRSEVRMAPPDGYAFDAVPVPAGGAGDRLLDWHVTSEGDRGDLVVRLESLRPSSRGSAKEYVELAEAVSAFLDAAEANIVLSRR